MILFSMVQALTPCQWWKRRFDPVMARASVASGTGGPPWRQSVHDGRGRHALRCCSKQRTLRQHRFRQPIFWCLHACERRLCRRCRTRGRCPFRSNLLVGRVPKTGSIEDRQRRCDQAGPGSQQCSRDPDRCQRQSAPTRIVQPNQCIRRSTYADEPVVHAAGLRAGADPCSVANLVAATVIVSSLGVLCTFHRALGVTMQT